jgi:hypothetical protein
MDLDVVPYVEKEFFTKGVEGRGLLRRGKGYTISLQF